MEGIKTERRVKEYTFSGKNLLASKQTSPNLSDFSAQKFVSKLVTVSWIVPLQVVAQGSRLLLCSSAVLGLCSQLRGGWGGDVNKNG